MWQRLFQISQRVKLSRSPFSVTLVTFDSLGWNYKTLTVEIDPNEEESALYHLNIHRVEIDNNGATLDGLLDDPGLIKSLCVWGI